MLLLAAGRVIEGPGCGAGTVEKDGMCVADDSAAPDTGEADGDTDTDADGDSDSDTDADGDADGDGDADSDTDSDADGDSDAEAAARWSGETAPPGTAIALSGAREEDYVGRTLAVGDEDGDGQDDLLIGAPFAFRGAYSAGLACLHHGPFTTDMDLDAGACVEGSAERAMLGATAAIGADIDGDGLTDTVIAEATTASAQDGATGPGEVHIFSGVGSGDFAVSDAVATWTGEGATDGAGVALSVASDLTGDGLVDVAVGAPSRSGVARGAAYVLAANAKDGGNLMNADVRFYPLDPAAGGGLGSVLVDLQDLDGDGNSDLGIGWSAHNANRGALAIFLGPFSGANDAADADALVTGLGGGLVILHHGTVLAGDVDGDGTGDLLLGAHEFTIDSTSYPGKAYLVSGERALDGTDVQLADATVQGEAYGDQVGRSVTGSGDHDGDGFADIVVGAMGDDTEAEDGGGAFAFYGPLSGTHTPADAGAAWHGVSKSASAGSVVLGAHELTGDGFLDLLISATGADGSEDSSGVVYMVPGEAP